MSQPKHTPGPWTVKRGVRDDFYLPQLQRSAMTTAIIRPDGMPIAEIPMDRLNANATLIAAAPEMLAVLQKVLIGEDTTDEVRAIIAKATGEAT